MQPLRVVYLTVEPLEAHAPAELAVVAARNPRTVRSIHLHALFEHRERVRVRLGLCLRLVVHNARRALRSTTVTAYRHTQNVMH